MQRGVPEEGVQGQGSGVNSYVRTGEGFWKEGEGGSKTRLVFKGFTVQSGEEMGAHMRRGAARRGARYGDEPSSIRPDHEP